ncbi:MAG TPA: hypothetical protein VF794_35060 [Archangium sp.]|jgi:hypothetical protein|uniref:hypothetical protein n=1 Tax=Archangium sp. TaxID=1872627 RepID=UPI002ED808D4
MNRRFPPCLLFTLCLSSAALAETSSDSTGGQRSSPAWVPHGVMLGTFMRGGAVAPQIRLNWQVPFFRGRKDTLSVLVEPLAAYTASYPDTVVEDDDVTMRALRLFSLVVGVGYRSRPEQGLEWGFQVGSGPAWYAARFARGSKERESYFVGLLDGRAQLGYNLGALSLGLTVGYGDIYNYRRTSLSRPYVGGLHLGLYLEWR